MPLKEPSHLYSEEIVQALLSITHGRMDNALDILKSAACFAIKRGTERITEDMLRRAGDNLWGY